MRYVDEFRDAALLLRMAGQIARLVSQPRTIMEICGGQTHSIVRHGIDRLLPDGVTLLHGPGCPVCVTAAETIDTAIAIARRPEVTFCSFGDMLRVPGTQGSLLQAKAHGADIRMVYSPLDALALARRLPEREVVFFAIGFETTAPASAMAALQAEKDAIANFSLLVSHVLVPPAIEAIMGEPENKVQGFLAAGHVCTVMGYWEYEPLARRYRTPVVVTGFEPLDLLHGIYLCLKQLEEGRAEVENAYSRMVKREGNLVAQGALNRVFAISPQRWRGIGEIADSGFVLAPAYEKFDAARKFGYSAPAPELSGPCISGSILRGLSKPHQCPAFGSPCTPESPLGATMVSSEGACAAYYRYRRHAREAGRESEIAS